MRYKIYSMETGKLLRILFTSIAAYRYEQFPNLYKVIKEDMR